MVSRALRKLASFGAQPPPVPPPSSDRGFFMALAELARRHEPPLAHGRLSTGSLTSRELRVFSQNGEDGIVAELIHRVGAGPRWFVEFGIEGGVEGNCVALAQVFGWSGLFLEADPADFARLARRYSGNPRVHTHSALVTPDNVEALLAAADVPTEFSILSIDVDGNDYWIWEAIRRYRPRVVIIEYNSHLPFAARLVQPLDDRRVWQETDNYGASLAALESLGRTKGYRLVHTDLTGVNAFFVRADLGEDLPQRDEVPQRAPNFQLTGRGHPPHPDPAPEYDDLDAGGQTG